MIEEYISENKISVAIFDMDGTLTDSNQAWSQGIISVLNRHSIDYTRDDWKDMMTIPTIQAAQHLRDAGRLPITAEDFTDEVTDEVRRLYREEVELKPGSAELVKRLSQMDLRLYIASSTDRREIELVLGEFGLLDYFDEVYPVAEFGTSKRERRAFDMILEKAGSDGKNYQAQDAVLFEDALYSMETGKKMGMHIVAIRDEFEKDQEDKIEEIADLYVNNPVDLL